MITTPALSWSCASDEVLAAQASPEDRARISTEVARQRGWADAMACIAEGRTDCPEAPDLTRPMILPIGG